jgi:SAM-dependent methyltransferase
MLPSWPSDRFDIPADGELLARLTADMYSRGGALAPADGWRELPEEQRRGTMQDMMEPWCGIAGATLAEVLGGGAPGYVEHYVAACKQYADHVDPADVMRATSLRDLAELGWRVLDLDSFIDFVHIDAFFDLTKTPATILEIGGGFGRMLEFMALMTGKTHRYINIDAVPVSLMYCHQYLKARFPAARVGMFDGTAASADCDYLVVPVWELDRLEIEGVDLGINIESMQEMHQASVDFYLDYLDRKVRDNGVIYLENSRDHEFIGNWRIPDNWECMFRSHTVRSWTLNHPTEVYRRTGQSQRAVNLLRSEAFRREMCFAAQANEMAGRDDCLAALGVPRPMLRRLLHTDATGVFTPPAPETPPN